jgi:penicillin amidase
MDAIRRLASGELAEIVGPVMLEQDRDSRRLRIRRIAEAAAASMPPGDRKWLAAYARGVNAYIDSQRSSLPVEFRLLAYQPRPWTVADSCAVAFQMYRQMTNSWDDEILKSALLAGGDADKVRQLFPVRTGKETLPGSNAWAISGRLTKSGKPILANDPHLAFSLPATWYQIHLEAAGLNVIGVTLPGLPAVMIGHNGRIAWGVTNLAYDVQDLYVERIDMNTGQYATGAGPARAFAEEERIAIKGQNPESVRQWVTRHGPAVFRNGDQVLALRWAAAEPGAFQFPLIDLNLARDWNEFRTALRRYPGPGMNFVYADVDGHIGYQAAGFLPERLRHDGDVPVDGAPGQFEWGARIPFDEMPSAFDPPSGMIVTANQNPWPPDAPRRIHGAFAPQYRANQIRALLQAKSQWSADEMLRIQTDVYSPPLHRLARAAAQSTSGKALPPGVTAEMVDLLKKWDGQMRADRPEPYLITLVYQSARRQIAEQASPKKAAAWTLTIANAVVDRLVQERPAGWFDSWDQVLLDALRDGAGEARRNQGSDPAKWRYGALHSVTVSHPILGKLPQGGQFFQVGPEGLNGSTTTVNQTSLTLGPSMRFVADLGDWEKSLNNLVVGQSGHRLSRHFDDQWEAYAGGTSFPMRFQKTEGDELTLLPAARAKRN